MGTSEYENLILQWRAKKVNDLVGENGWMESWRKKAILKFNKEAKPSSIT